MATITHEPVRKARDKLVDLSADAETRRLAFVRERALLDEASLLKDAREEGREEGHNNALRQTAMTMIRESTLDDQTIAAYTGLAVGEVAGLRRGGST